MLTLDQKVAVYDRVRHFVTLGNDVFDTDLDQPHVKFDKRGTTAGTAFYKMMELDFNVGLLLENWEEFMNQTIPHEVSHLLKEHMYGRGKGMLTSHGLMWQKTMRGLGVDPDRTHNMDISKVAMPKKKFIYVCEGCGGEFILSSVRHNRMLRGVRTYSHCSGTSLTLKKRLGKMTILAAMDHKTPGFMKKAAQKAAPKKKAHVPCSTKIGRAMIAYNTAKNTQPEITRQKMITVLADIMQVDRKAAAGYYQTCKKKAA